METKAKLTGASVDYLTRCLDLTFRVPADDSIKVFIDEHLDRDLRLKAVKWHEKRSLNANAYFHVLCEKIAQARCNSGDVVTSVRVKNEMLGDYGCKEYIGEDLAIFKTNIPYEQLLEQEHLHLKLAKVDGATIFCYVMRGTHTYNSYEMSALINGVVEVAKGYGIDTLPREELERLYERYREV